jgi:hypothetical protein
MHRTVLPLSERLDPGGDVGRVKLSVRRGRVRHPTTCHNVRSVRAAPCCGKQFITSNVSPPSKSASYQLDNKVHVSLINVKPWCRSLLQKIQASHEKKD